MGQSIREFAIVISKSLISTSTKTLPPRTWSPSLEQTLHHLHCRTTLTPSLIAAVIDPFLLHHPSLSLGFFNWASQQPNFTHTSLSYQALLKSLSVSKQFNIIANVLTKIDVDKGCVDSEVYSCVIDCLVAGKKTRVAFSVFEEVGERFFDVGFEACNNLLAGLTSQGDFKCARKVFDKMISRNVEFTTVGFGVFLWRFCCGVEIGECLSLIEGVRRNKISGIDGSIIAVLVVHGLCSRMRLDEAVFALEELRKRECKPDFMAYRVVAEALRDRGRLDKMDNVLKSKRKLGVAPRANEYGRFILSLISHKLICEAKEIAEVIVTGNFPIEDDVLNALISSVSSVDPCSAVSFLNFMLSKQRFPTLPSLIDLSNNLMKHGKCNDLMEMINHLSVKDFFKDVESYKEMIMLMCKMGSVHEAYQLLQEMKRKGINPDVEAYNIILEACCREDKLRPARRLWDEMFVNGYVVDRKSYCILISKFSEVGEVDEAYRMFCQMIGNGIVPDRSSYLAVLEGFCKAKDPERAVLVFGKSVEQDLTLSQHILGEFIFCLCKEGYFLDASNLLRDSKAGSGQLDSHVRLLKLLGNAREVPLAMEHIKWIRQRSPQELHGVHAALSASLHSSMELDQIIMFCELQKTMVLICCDSENGQVCVSSSKRKVLINYMVPDEVDYMIQCSSITSLPSPSLPFDQVTSTKSNISFQE